MSSTNLGRSARAWPEVRTLLLTCFVVMAGMPGASPADAETDGAAATTTWSAQLRSTAYFYQVEDATEAETDLMPFYEHFDLGVGRLANDHLDLRFSGRFATDLGDEGAVDGEDRLYVAYALLRFAPGRTHLRLGRQFLQEGTVRHTLDGAWLSTNLSRNWQLHAWGGGQSPVRRDFDTPEFGDEAAYGARLTGRVHPRARIGAWLATRKSGGETSATPLGGELLWSPSRALRALTRATYDLEGSEFERFDVLTTLRPREDLPMLTVQYVDRKPVIEAGSWFARFNEDLQRVRVLRAALRHETEVGIGAEIESFSSWVDDRNTNRFGVALIVPYARVGWSTKSGDAGDDSRFYGDVHYEVDHWLQLSGGATFSEYSLLADEAATDEESDRELVTLFARARAELRPGLRVLCELQSLENPFYSEDTRVLLGLDLSMGRGASNFGWGTGGAH